MATEQSERPDLKLAPETGDVLFDVKDLEVYFPIQQGFFKSMVATEKKFVKAVDHISFQVMQGEILALVGESGCGKTTTGRTLLRLEDATGGEILYKGLPVAEVQRQGRCASTARRRRSSSRTPTTPSIPSRRSSTSSPSRSRSTTSARASARRKSGSSRRSARPACGRRPSTSTATRTSSRGGQRQRVCIAGATVLDPDVIVADEPVASLDVSIRNDILKLMVEEKEKLGVTYIFITHDLSLAWVISDRIAVMYLGRIVEIGETEEVVANPQAPLHQGAHQRHPGARPAGQARARHPQGRDARTRSTSPPAAASTRAARRRSTPARRSTPRTSTSAATTTPPASGSSSWEPAGAVTPQGAHRPGRLAPGREEGAGMRAIVRAALLGVALLALAASRPPPRPAPAGASSPSPAPTAVTYRIGIGQDYDGMNPFVLVERHLVGVLPPRLRLPHLVRRRLRARARRRHELGDVRGRQDLDLPHPRGHEVAGRRAAHARATSPSPTTSSSTRSTGPTSST